MRETLATERDSKCWVLTHLQKCGGSTLKHLVGDHWAHELVIYDTRPWLKGTTYADSFGRNVTLRQEPLMVSGAYTEALRHSMGHSCMWSIVFRHPISRLVSAYFYCKKSRDSSCAHSILDQSETNLEGFARHWGNFGLRQLALSIVPADDVLEFATSEGILEGRDKTEHWAGWYLMKMYLEHKGKLVGGDERTALYPILTRVREKMASNFAVVGILEEFDTTLEMFDCALGMPEMDWRGLYASVGKHNVDNSFRGEKEAVLAEAWTNAKIKEYIDLDLLLYEHAVDVFNSQAAAYGMK